MREAEEAAVAEEWPQVEGLTVSLTLTSTLPLTSILILNRTPTPGLTPAQPQP